MLVLSKYIKCTFFVLFVYVCVCVCVCYLSVQKVKHQKENMLVLETNAATMALINAWLIFDQLMCPSWIMDFKKINSHAMVF